MFHSTNSRLSCFYLLFLCLAAVSVNRAAAQSSVTTYHNDNNRTGWNATETVLTPAKVSGGSFGQLYSGALDDQVDAQPLVVSGVTITTGRFTGLHNVVYVATEGNAVYAVGVNSGNIFLRRNLGTPVHLPLGCQTMAQRWASTRRQLSIGPRTRCT